MPPLLYYEKEDADLYIISEIYMKKKQREKITKVTVYVMIIVFVAGLLTSMVSIF